MSGRTNDRRRAPPRAEPEDRAQAALREREETVSALNRSGLRVSATVLPTPDTPVRARPPGNRVRNPDAPRATFAAPGKADTPRRPHSRFHPRCATGNWN